MANLIEVMGPSIPIGSIIQCTGAPDSSWLKCDGSILDQADYPVYINQCEDLHPMIWKEWSFVDVDQSTTGVQKNAIDRIGDLIVCVGNDSTVWVSTDAGATWSTNTGLGSGAYRVLANNGSIFVTALYNGSTAYYSSDGSTWTSATLPLSRYWEYLSYANGTFVLMHGSYASPTTSYAYSSDGSTWNTGTAPYSSGYCQALFSDGSKHILFAYYNNSFYKIYTSTDGSTWSSGTSDFFFGSPDYNDSVPLGAFYLNNNYYMFYYYNDFWYLKYEGTDIKDPNDWYQYPMFSRGAGFSSFTVSCAAWTGSHYILPNGYASEDGLLVGKSFDNLSLHRSPFYGCKGIVNDGEDWAVCLPTTTGWHSVVRSVGVNYTKATQFQIPLEVVPDCTGIYSYIKMS